MRNGKLITLSDFSGRFSSASNGLVHTLTLKDLTLKDSGEFSVTTEEISSKCNLTVKECIKKILS